MRRYRWLAWNVRVCHIEREESGLLFWTDVRKKKILWCNKLAQGAFLTRVYKPLKKIAWLGSWGGESVRPGSTACLHRTWGTPDRNPRQYRDTCLRIQLSHNPHLPQFHVSTSDFREAISAFDLWTLGGEHPLGWGLFLWECRTFITVVYPLATQQFVPVAWRAAVGEELDFLSLGITNIPAARIPVVGTLSRPPLLPWLMHLCVQSSFWQTYFQ